VNFEVNRRQAREGALGCEVNRRQAREGALGCKVNCVTREDATAMTTLITLLIGMFIGWNLPQPDWARAIQDKVVSLFQSLINK
jgi:hypothetical protein